MDTPSFIEDHISQTQEVLISQNGLLKSDIVMV